MPRSGASSPVRRRTVVGLAGIGAVAVLLAGCTVEPPTPEPEAPVVAAVVSASQERKILESVTGVLEGAGKADEASSLGARLSGPALAAREAELKVAAARGDDAALTDLTMETRQVVLPSDQGWPRTSFVITAQPESGVTPVLAAFDQASAREQYKMWGYVRLVPGVTMPQFAEEGLGSAAVAADDTSLKVAPEAVAEQYASVLTAGDRSKHAESFTDDDHLRTILRQSGKDQVASIEAKNGEGTFEVAYEPTEDPVKAVRTVDGGAMVLVALLSQETLTAEDKWKLVPGAPSAKALWGDAEGSETMKIAYRDMAALYVPPAGSADQVSLLGFHRVPYAVSNS